MEVHIEFMDGSTLMKSNVIMMSVEPYVLNLCQNWREADHWEHIPLVNIKRWRTEH